MKHPLEAGFPAAAHRPGTRSPAIGLPDRNTQEAMPS